ncbi:MAG: serine/threonine-protein kinase [Cyanobacteria bacterium J06631_2]
MEIICTRPSCVKPSNFFGDLDTEAKIRTVQQRYCSACGMPLLLADRYIPEKLLGQGGFGAAFLARDRYKPKLPLCVVKQFKPSSELDAAEVQMAQELFEREAIALEELGKKHPQIPNLYAFFTPIVQNTQRTGSEQYFYLAQEYIDGQDLEQELEAKGQFSEAEVVEVLTEILKVLEFVHEQEVIHRDIKPSNIMRNKQGVLYLLDFGAVKQIAAGGGNRTKSTGIYSMGFAPPEQMSGSQVYPSTDIYALAVTCLSLLTGKQVDELYDSFNNVWQWHQFAPDISDRLKQALDRMLLPTPAKRFSSAKEALDALAIAQPHKASSSTAAQLPSAPQAKPTLIHPPHQPATSNPATPVVPAVHNSQVAKPTRRKRKKQPFSLTETISSAAFAGFEGALIFIGMTSWLAPSAESIGIVGALMGGIVFALYRRAIEKVDLVILALVTAGVVAFIPKFNGALNAPTVIVIATVAAASAIAIVVFFRLVYQLLSRFLA